MYAFFYILSVTFQGMVYVDSTELKWMPYVKSWLNTLPDTVKNEHRLQIAELFGTYFENGLTFCSKNCVSPIAQVSALPCTVEIGYNCFPTTVVPLSSTG